MRESWNRMNKKERRRFIAALLALILGFAYFTYLLIWASSINDPVEDVIAVEPPETFYPIQIVEQDYEEISSSAPIGVFTLTAYCSCEKCCGYWANNRPVDEMGNEIVIGASGDRLIPNVSVAVDPSVIEYGTELEIDGKTYIAHDCGGAIQGNRIDVYFSDHQDALNFGIQEKDVYIKGGVSI